MYRIEEDKDNEKYILLVPAMLDAHFPVLKYCFYSKNYRPVILENETNITQEGLHYVNNDMCYPCILNTGQMIAALKSGKYDLNRTRLLMPTAGDACRGSNYTGVIRRALAKAGFDQVKVLSLNVKGLEKDEQLQLEFGMVWRALFGLFYGDILMLLTNQLRPYERDKGSVERCRNKWIENLSMDLKRGKHLTLFTLRKNFLRMAEDFSKIELLDVEKQKIGIVGELYIKYCHLGNWNLISKLEEDGCESYTNGLSWYVLYYMDSHLADAGNFWGLLYRLGIRFIGKIQKSMVKSLKKYHFYCMEEFAVFKKEAAPYVNFHNSVGDGWLIGAEIVGHIRNGYKKVVAVQPFGCMPNQICGHGVYPKLQRMLPQGQIAAVDVDASGSPLNVWNRIKVLLDYKQKEEK